jgi:hypothetical protein
MTGRLMLEQSVGEKELLLNVASLRNGIYNLEITSEKGTNSRKLVLN